MDDIQLDQGEPWEVKPENFRTYLRSFFSVDSRLSGIGVNLEEERKELQKALETDADYRSNLETYFASLDKNISQLKQVNSIQEGGRLVSELEQLQS